MSVPPPRQLHFLGREHLAGGFHCFVAADYAHTVANAEAIQHFAEQPEAYS